MAAGKTRQQARGHTAREHVTRAEREREEHGLSVAEMRSIRSWYNGQFNPLGQEKVDVEEIIDFARDQGFAWFQNYREVWNAQRRRYKRELNSGEWASMGEAHLEYLAALADVPETDWLYYH